MSDTLHWRGGWARVSPWRGDDRVAHLVVGTEIPPTDEVVQRCVERIRGRGYEAVVTSALTAAESLPFVDAGFALRERLHLLEHDLSRLPARRHGTRRARPRDRSEVLAIDALAFAEFWHFDDLGLDEAIAATPISRFRVIEVPGERGALAGYAVSGRAGAFGYLQRVAVHPSHRGGGLGNALVADALRWFRRHRVERALVNTQVGNDAALELYARCGFRRLPVWLSVLGRSL